MGGGRHRLPQRWRPLGGSAAPVLRHAGQDRQLPAGGVGQRRYRAGQLPAGLAVVPARELGRRSPAALVLPPARAGAAPAQVAAGVGHARRARGVGSSPTGAGRRLGRWEVGEFRSGLDDRQIGYVVQVKADTSAYPEQTPPTVTPSTGRVGVPGRATATSPARSPSSPWRPGRRPAWS
jgi:hypothetical protein